MGFNEYMYNHPSVHMIFVCVQTPGSFFLKSALMAPFSCGPTAFLKVPHPLYKGLRLIHVMNVLHDGFRI